MANNRHIFDYSMPQKDVAAMMLAAKVGTPPHIFQSQARFTPDELTVRIPHSTILTVKETTPLFVSAPDIP
jgi:hypothetical protein